MRKQGNICKGLLPFVLGLALILGCDSVSAGKLYAAEAGSEDSQAIGEQSTGDSISVGVDKSGSTTIKNAPTRKKNGKAARAQGQATAPSASPNAAVSPPGLPEGIGTPGLARKQYTGKTVSLDLLDADLRNVLRLLSDLTSTNIVIEPDVAGKVTLKVEQVPWDQVLDMVLAMNGLGKEQVGNVIRIAKQTKLKQEWSQQAEAIRARQELNETTKDMGDLATTYLPINFGKPAEIAAKIAEAKSERGKISVDERTSLIIYTDYPARVANARQLISRLDRQTPQVLIEARIITLKSTVTRDLGVNLSFHTSHQTTPTPTLQDFFLNAPIAGTPQFGMSLAQLIGKTLVNVDLAVSALETANEARVVAAPRVLTLDNVKAVVTQGIQVPYLKVNDANSSVSSTEFKDATLELQVTPHITPDRRVRMTLDAKQDTVSTTVFAGGQPGIDTRKISTELLVDDGNVIVIGGVIDNSFSHTKDQTPGLSQVPLLGRLFKSETSEDKRNELLIFISPKIVEVTKPFDRT